MEGGVHAAFGARRSRRPACCSQLSAKTEPPKLSSVNAGLESELTNCGGDTIHL